MTRLFTDRIDGAEGSVLTLSPADSHYVVSVLRMRPGEELTVVDSERNEALCEVSVPDQKACQLKITKMGKNDTESPLRITLYQSVSKGERMDLTIQKAVELGVSSVVPVFSERCVVRPEKDERKKSAKNERWQKIALEAARQSGRGIVPEVRESMSFEDAVREAAKAHDLALIPWEEEKGETLKNILDESGDVRGIAVFIGPEGGFSSEEAELARSSGLKSVTLGRRILRTETAGPAVLAMLLYRFEL